MRQLVLNSIAIDDLALPLAARAAHPFLEHLPSVLCNLWNATLEVNLWRHFCQYSLGKYSE